MSTSFYVDIEGHFEDYTEECWTCMGDRFETVYCIDESFIGPMPLQLDEYGLPELGWDGEDLTQRPMHVAAFRCGHCYGTGILERSRSKYAEANFSQSSARLLLGMIGIIATDDLIGAVKPEDVNRKIRTMIRLLNGDVYGATSESFEYGGPGTGHCRVIDCGRSEDYILGAIEAMLSVFLDAQRHHAGVYWA